MSRWAVVALVVVVSNACRPAFDEDSALVTTPRILAVKSEPAEAKPGTSLTFTAFVAVPSAAVDAGRPIWDFCSAPKPPTEDNVVSSACFDASSLAPAGAGLTVSAQIPSNACTLFGPNAASTGFRPRDPDITGGYFQPLRVDLPGAAPMFHLQRILCGLADASADIATSYGTAYVANQNPSLLPLVASVAQQGIALDAIPKGASVTLEASFPADAVENYAYFDRAAQTVTTRREAMRVAWYVSAGKLETETTGRAEDDPALDTSNTWSAPNIAGVVKLWLVLSDSRGGSDFAAYDLTVSP